MFRFSLISGWFPPLVVSAALGALGRAVTYRWRGWWKRVGVSALVTAVADGVAAAYMTATHALEFSWPPSFYLWIGLAVFTAGLALLGWRHAAARRRLSLGVATALTSAMALTLINSHYGYYPSSESLAGETALHHASEADLARLSSRAVDPMAGGAGQLRFGRTVSVDIPAANSHFRHRRSLVYLPPAWFTLPHPRLPVIVLLAGTPGLTSDWTRAAFADRTADSYAAAHGGLAPILVLADHNGSNLGDSECVDGPRGAAESYLTIDVPRFVMEHFQTATGGNHWAVAGLSEGGTCAVMLSLRHPDVFGTFGDFSGDLAPNMGGPGRTARLLYGGDTSQIARHDPLQLLASRPAPAVAGWFEVGEEDHRPRRCTERLARAAVAAGLDVQLMVRHGRHSFPFWGASFRHSLPWLAQHVGLDGAGAAGGGGMGAAGTSKALPT
jgi:S-formylglutathione hydrolase FrmB